MQPSDRFDIVCISTNDWTGLPTSKQHLMSVLSEDRRVLFVDPPTDVFSVIGRRRRWPKLGGVRRVRERLWVLSPLVASVPSGPTRMQAYHGSIAPRVRSAARRLGIESPVLWTFSPEHSPYVGAMGERVAVYQAADEPAAFSSDPGATAALERAHIEAVGLVLVASESLLEARAASGKAHRLPNAADVRHYKGAIADDADAEDELFVEVLKHPTRIPAEFDDLERPIVFYGGAAYGWFDFDLLAEVARRRPDWSFVLVGPVGRGPASRGLPGNVRLLGRRDYDDFPGYVLGADVAILPWRDGPFSRNADPIVLYEYLLCGKPVVATPFRAALEKGALVRTADSAEAFGAAIEEGLAERPGGEGFRSRVSYALANTWESRAATAIELIGEVLRREGAEDGPAKGSA